MRPILLATLTLLAALALAGCTSAPPIPVGRPFVDARVELPGCYALFAGGGRPLDGDFYNSSPKVLLDTAHLALRPSRLEYRMMLRLDGAGRRMEASRPGPPAWRYDVATDTVELSFLDGMSGVKLFLHAPPGRRDTLRGRIDDNWDFGPPFIRPRGAGYAVRIPCHPDAA